jgi:glycosyltransferase involved in cell wall biosynthesis
MSKNILMVTYDFPPIGGGGVQRNLKFLKYLSRLGWDTSVLTVKERDYYVFDHTLLNELDSKTKIYRSGSLDPISISFKVKKLLKKIKDQKTSDKSSNETVVNEDAWHVSLYRLIRNWVLLPDGYGGWIPIAYRLGKKIIKEHRPDVLFATFPGPSNAFVTYKLSKKFNIPYVIDFRDGWTDDPYTTFPSYFHRQYHSHYERKILLSAERIIVYGEALKNIFERRYPTLENKVKVITNGFDPEDFTDLKPVSKSKDKVRIVYSGAVYVDRRETYINFIKAVASFSDDFRNKFEIIFVGDKLKWATDLVISNRLENVISFTGYLSHKEALNYLASADASLMFLKIGDKVALTGKIFEYLGLELPVIACVEREGTCAKLLKSIDHDQGVCDPSDPAAIATKIEKLVKVGFPKLNNKNKNVYSREWQSQVLGELLDAII